MFLKFVTCVADKSLDQLRSTLHAALRVLDQHFQVRQMITGDISQISKIQIAPNPFGRVEVRGIAWQLLQVDTLGSSVCQVGFDDPGAMRRNTVLDNQEQIIDHAQQLAKKEDDFSARNRMSINRQKQLALGRDRPDERKMLMGQKFLQDRCLAAGCIRTHDHRQHVYSRFIYKDDGSSFFDRLFFNSGQRTSFQCWISASLRCLARRIGFWGVQPRSLRMRLTWAGWYRTPNSRSINLPTRAQVHSSPRNAKLSGPLASKPESFWRSAALKRIGAPDLGCSVSPASPPSLPRLIHWLTAPWLTPRASAMSFCFQPVWYKAQARLRRSSFQLVVLSFALWPIRPHFSYLCKDQ